MRDRFLGSFLNLIYIQHDGIHRTLDTLQTAGFKGIAFFPHLARPAEDGKGKRFPDLHIDGHRRVLARPLWSKHALQLQRFLGYEPNPEFYRETPYRPLPSAGPAGLDGELIDHLIHEAHQREMQVHIQLHPFLPPGVAQEDQPVYINGDRPEPPQVAAYACLNSPQARIYAFALLQDTVARYPDIKGLFTDWVEYGAYRLEDHFVCFCPHCERKALEAGFDWQGIRREVRALWDWLHKLAPQDLESARALWNSPSGLLELLTHYPGWLSFLRFKAMTVVGFYREARQLLDATGHEHITLSARGWPPPWNRSSGMDYRQLAEVCAAVTPKLFTFDYCALPRWYGETLLRWNPRLAESEILDTLVDIMDLPDEIEPRSFAHYHIPAPDEPHPAKLEAYRRRALEVVAQVNGRAKCYPFAHAYLPEPQWEGMIQMLRESPVDGIWVQMYGYLSNQKLAILRRNWT